MVISVSGPVLVSSLIISIVLVLLFFDFSILNFYCVDLFFFYTNMVARKVIVFVLPSRVL